MKKILFVLLLLSVSLNAFQFFYVKKVSLPSSMQSNFTQEDYEEFQKYQIRKKYTEQQYVESQKMEDLNKLKIGVYFNQNASDVSISNIKAKIDKKFPEVKITWLSNEQVLERWKKVNENDQTAIQALEDLTENPMGSEFVIQTNSHSETKLLAQYISANDTDNIIAEMEFTP